MRLSPLTRRRLDAFRRNRRGFWALWLFLALFVVTLGAELVANDRPIVVSYQGSLYFPVVKNYPEVTFGGDFLTYTDYRDPYMAAKIAENGWALWPPIRHDYQSLSTELTRPHPAPPPSP